MNLEKIVSTDMTEIEEIKQAIREYAEGLRNYGYCQQCQYPDLKGVCTCHKPEPKDRAFVLKLYHRLYAIEQMKKMTKKVSNGENNV